MALKTGCQVQPPQALARGAGSSQRRCRAGCMPQRPAVCPKGLANVRHTACRACLPAVQRGTVCGALKGCQHALVWHVWEI